MKSRDVILREPGTQRAVHLFHRNPSVAEFTLMEHTQVEELPQDNRVNIDTYSSGTAPPPPQPARGRMVPLLLADLDPKGKIEVEARLDPRDELIFQPYSTKKYPDDSIESGVLTKDQPVSTVHGEIWCAKDTPAMFFEDGSLQAATLARDITIKDMKLLAGTIIVFNEDHALVQITLPDKQKVGRYEFHKGTVLYFDENGKLSEAKLSDEHNLDGIPLSHEAIIRVKFHENGRIKSGFLADDFTFATYNGNVPCKKGSYIEFHENGKLMVVTLAAPLDICGKSLPKDTGIFFDEKYNLHQIVVPTGQEMKFQGQLFHEQTAVEFDDKGKLSGAKLMSEHNFDGKWCRGGKIVGFHEGGELKYMHSGRDQEIDGTQVLEGESMYLFRNGKLNDIEVKEERTIRGHLCRAGETITFFDDGSVVRAFLSEKQTHTIHGIICKKGLDVEYYDTGVPKSLQLAESSGHVFLSEDAGARVHETFCEKDYENGVPLYGQPLAEFISAPGSTIDFYKNGSIEYAEPALDYTVETDADIITCLAGKIVAFYEDEDKMFGKLKYATLAVNQDITITRKDGTTHTILCAAGTQIELRKDDTVSKATLAGGQAQEIDGVWCAAGAEIELDSEGRLTSVSRLSKNQPIKEIICREGETVTFHDNGMPQVATIGAPQTFGDRVKVKLTTGDGAIFYKSGTLKFTKFSIPQRTGNPVKVKFGAGDISTFYKNGNLGQAIFSDNQYIQDIFCKAKTETNFHKNGRLQSARLAKDQLVAKHQIFDGERGIFAKKDTEVVLFDDGSLKNVILGKKRKLLGVVLPANTSVTFHSGGGPETIELVAEATVQGDVFPKGSLLTFSNGGRLVRAALGDEQTIQGIKCSDTLKIEFFEESGAIRVASAAANQTIKNGVQVLEDDVITFHDGGGPRIIYLAYGRTIDGIPCARETDAEFYESGALKSGRLSFSRKIRGYHLEAGSEVYLHDNGSLKMVLLARQQKVGDLECAGLSTVEFHDNGKVKSAISAIRQRIILHPPWENKSENAPNNTVQEEYGLFCAANAKVEYHDNGILSLVNELSSDQDIFGFKCNASWGVDFHKSGMLKSAILVEDKTVDDSYSCGRGNPVSLYDDGSLHRCYLSGKHVINGISRFKDTLLELYKGGIPKSISYMGHEKMKGVEEFKFPILVKVYVTEEYDEEGKFAGEKRIYPTGGHLFFQ